MRGGAGAASLGPVELSDSDDEVECLDTRPFVPRPAPPPHVQSSVTGTAPLQPARCQPQLPSTQPPTGGVKRKAKAVDLTLSDDDDVVMGAWRRRPARQANTSTTKVKESSVTIDLPSRKLRPPVPLPPPPPPYPAFERLPRAGQSDFSERPLPRRSLRRRGQPEPMEIVLPRRLQEQDFGSSSGMIHSIAIGGPDGCSILIGAQSHVDLGEYDSKRSRRRRRPPRRPDDYNRPGNLLYLSASTRRPQSSVSSEDAMDIDGGLPSALPEARLLDAHTQETQVHELQYMPVDRVVVSPTDPSVFLSCGDDGHVNQWVVGGPKGIECVSTWNYRSKAQHLTFHPSGNLFALFTPRSYHIQSLHDPPSGQSRAVLRPPRGKFSPSALAFVGTRAVVLGAEEEKEHPGCARGWAGWVALDEEGLVEEGEEEEEEGEKVRDLEEVTGAVAAITASESGTYLAIACEHGGPDLSVVLYTCDPVAAGGALPTHDCTYGVPARLYPGKLGLDEDVYVPCLGISPDERYIALGKSDNTVDVRFLGRAHEPLYTFSHEFGPNIDHQWGITCLRFLPLPIHPPRTFSLSSLPSYPHARAAPPFFLLTGGADGVVRVWDPRGAEQQSAHLLAVMDDAVCALAAMGEGEAGGLVVVGDCAGQVRVLGWWPEGWTAAE